MQRTTSLQTRTPVPPQNEMLNETYSSLRWYLRRWNNRLRLRQTLEWLPRALILGVFISVVIASLARLDYWLTEDGLWIAIGGIMAASVLLALAITAFWRVTEPLNPREFLRRLLIYVPQMVALGLLVSVCTAILTRARPRLLPEEVVQVSVVLTIATGVLTVLLIWLWPRPEGKSARNFDQRFDLRERLSTALEISKGQLLVTPAMVNHQLEDARTMARRVSLPAALPLKIYWQEVLILTLSILALVLLVVIESPFTRQIREREDLNQAIAEEADKVEDARTEIEQNSELTEQEQAELSEPLDELLEELEQDDLSLEEAVAAMAEAEQELREMGEGLTDDEREANEQVGNELRQNAQTNEVGEELAENDLQGTANELRELANDLESMSEEERQALADQLEQAAQSLAETNPELAQQLQDAANELREGDIEGAQNALNQAAETAEAQQQENRNSPMAEAAREAADQVEQSQRDLSEAGQDGERRESNQQGEQSSGQSPQQQGQQVQQQSNQSQSGQQPGTQQQTEGQGEAPQGGQSAEQAGEGEQAGQQGQQPGEGQQEGQQGQQPGDGQQPGNAQQGTDGSAQGQQGSNADPQAQTQGEGSGESNQAGSSNSAGSGSDSAGSDSQNGGSSDGQIDTNNQAGQEGTPSDYEPVYTPQRIGDDSSADPTDTIQGELSETNNEDPEFEGQFNENFEDGSEVPYNEVFAEYQREAQEALDSDYIPIGLRDFIRVYFTSIEP